VSSAGSEIERKFGALVINFEVDRNGKILAVKMKGIKDGERKDIADGIGFLDIVTRHPRLSKDGRIKVRDAKKHLQSALVGFQT